MENFMKNKHLTMRAIITIILFAVCEKVRAECDTCQASNAVACHSETVFSLCIDGVATRDYITCPEGSVCTEDYLVCYSQAESTASCSRQSIVDEGRGGKCGVCSEPNKVFSCIDETTIAFCFGNDAPIEGATGFCPEGTVCDITNPVEFCSLASEAEPSCIPTSTTTEETTTESTTGTTSSAFPRDPDTLCREVGQSGSYRPDDDVTCTQFILCYQMNDVWIGLLKDCPESTYFDTISALCVDEKPASCGSPEGTTEMSTTEETTTISTSTTEETTMISTSTTEETTTMSTSTTEETTSSSVLPRDPDTLCREVGQSGSYRPDDDVTCTQFILCYQMNDVWIGLLKDCPESTYFDSISALCVDEKPASCGSPEGTTEMSTTEETTTISTSTTEETTMISTSTTEETTTMSTSTTEETTSSSVLPRDPDTLCREVGQSGSYRPDDDVTCTQFILCYQMNDVWIGLLKDCPESTYFDSISALCVDEKPASCGSPEGTTEMSTTEETTTISTSTTEETTTMSTSTTEETTSSSVLPRDPDTLCREIGQSGSYRPDDDVTCTQFIMCYQINDVWVGLLQECPESQYFDSATGACGVQKPESCSTAEETTTMSTSTTEETTMISTSTTEETTTMSTSTTEETTSSSVLPRDPDTLCREMGQSGSYRPDDDVTCTQFIICYQINDVWVGLLQECPESQYFDSATGACGVQKPESCSTAEETTTMSTSTTEETTMISTSTTEETTTMSTSTTEETTSSSVLPRDPDTLCREMGQSGSYRPDDDVTCTQFIICYQINDVWVGLLENCPDSQYFDPSTGVCGVQKPESCYTSEESTTTITAATTTEETTTTTMEDTTETTLTTPATPRDPNTLCKEMGESGSYRPDGDTTCTEFILCYELNGNLRGLLRECPEFEYFDPVDTACTAEKPESCT